MANKTFKNILAHWSWPALFCACIATSAAGYHFGHPIIAFNIAYFSLAATLFFLERYMPFEKTWQDNDGQTFANLAHTLTSKGVVQGVVIFSGAIGITTYITPADSEGYGIWPRDWPMLV